MNIYGLSFGDYYDDGHGKHQEIFIQTENIDSVLTAKKEINRKNLYLANDYEDSSLCDKTWKLLIESNYTITQLAEALDNRIDEDYATLEEFVNSDDNQKNYLFINGIIDIYLHLLRYFGAEFTVVPVEIIDCDAGYGCFG
jgi:hypothetical protein